ncbi:hypothetical protein [Saccharomonospora saliphila]|uniref:hypothetical protein n=1 Tax=Saccharomonospora saliphila TaxID=369829 RepID=UPI0003699B74|nr:hypothetical protein [Saccharomonospora saliphila]
MVSWHRTVRTLAAVLAGVITVGMVSCSGVEGSADDPTGRAGRGTDADAVAEVFTRHREAVRGGDGATAAALISDETASYYALLADLAATAGPERIAELPALDRSNVGVFRIASTPEEMGQRDGRQTYAFAVTEGLLTRSGVGRHDLGEVTVEGNRAVADALTEGEPAPFEYEFERVGDAWRINLLPMITMSRSLLARLAEERGTSQEKLALQLIESATGQAVDESLFARPRG